MVTICSADCFTEDQIDVGIFTLPEHCRRGLAALAAAATVEAAFKKGFQKVGWHCHTDNIASWKTAEKVGFKREQTYLYYFYDFDVIDHLAALGCFLLNEVNFRKRSIITSAFSPPAMKIQIITIT